MESIGNVLNQNRKIRENITQKARGQFTQIPNSLIISKSFTIYEKMVWIVIKKYLMRHDTCWPGISTIADNARCGDSSVKKAIKSLEERGIITKDKQSNRKSNIYRIVGGNPWVTS